MSYIDLGGFIHLTDCFLLGLSANHWQAQKTCEGKNNQGKF